MATINFPNARVQIKWIVWIFSVALLVQSGILLFVKDEAWLVIWTDLTSPFIGLVSTIILFYTFWKLRPVSSRFSIAWLFLAIGCLGWVLGDVFWAVLEVFLHQEPFPSIADLFYLLYFPLVIGGILLMPYNRQSLSDRIKNWLDLGIVFMAAGLIYWNFLIVPTASVEDVDWLSFLAGLAYPVFDFVLFAALSLLLYRKQTLLSFPAQLLLISSVVIQIIADTIYGLQSIAGTYITGTFLDMSWQVGFVTFGLAGVVQLRSANQVRQVDSIHDGSPLRHQIYSWLAFSPYIWLAAAYALMIYSEFTVLPMNRQTISVGIGIMIALVLVRQIMSILETTRLSENLKMELIERQHAQELLLKSQNELEERVRQRTSELSEANRQLQSEIEERLRTEKQLEESLDEKNMLLKEIHHRVKNNLQVISSMLRLQSSHVKDPALISSLMDSQNRVQSMALIHEKLYQSTNLANINFAEYLESLAAFLYRSYNPTQKVIDLKVEAEPLTLGIDFAVPCGLIVNELVSNALKHAFQDRDGGEIIIRLKETETHQIQLSVSDNGVGISENVDINHSPSLGLQLVNALVDQLEGRIEVDNGKGTWFTITFSI